MRIIDADALLKKAWEDDFIEVVSVCDIDDAPTISPKWLYRLESKSKENGLWYNSKNELVWGIGKLPNCKTKDLPMDYDERYHKDGRKWFSSCSRKEDLMHWYSVQDALDLIANGFVFTRYLATEYVEYELETTFIKETCLAREEISIEELFGKQSTIEQPKWISCAESLPDKDGTFLVVLKSTWWDIDKRTVGEIAYFSTKLNRWLHDGGMLTNVTHWMSLPQPPKGDE